TESESSCAKALDQQMDQSFGLRYVPRAACRSDLARAWGQARREPGRVHPTRYRRLDAPLLDLHAQHHTPPQALESAGADSFSPHAWPVRVLLRLPALRHVHWT